MNIVVEERGGNYHAAMDGLAGAPPVGSGQTEAMAVACLFVRLLWSDYREAVVSLLKEPCYLSINGVLWERLKCRLKEGR